MKMIYVASPCRAEHATDVVRNHRRTIFYCKKVVELGNAPIVPHLMFKDVLNDDPRTNEWRHILSCNKEYVSRCDEVWFFPNPDFTQGMLFEADWADGLGKTIRIFKPGHPFREGEPS